MNSHGFLYICIGLKKLWVDLIQITGCLCPTLSYPSNPIRDLSSMREMVKFPFRRVTSCTGVIQLCKLWFTGILQHCLKSAGLHVSVVCMSGYRHSGRGQGMVCTAPQPPPPPVWTEEQWQWYCCVIHSLSIILSIIKQANTNVIIFSYLTLINKLIN